ncbi:hypothetical protein L1887_62975 [Cichorium endivia]|nr:hypothetical protein L1887_62975 [Cichorium endivia]
MDWAFEYPVPDEKENDVQQDGEKAVEMETLYRNACVEFEYATRALARAYGDAALADAKGAGIRPKFGRARGNATPADDEDWEPEGTASLRANRDILATKVRVAWLRLKPYVNKRKASKSPELVRQHTPQPRSPKAARRSTNRSPCIRARWPRCKREMRMASQNSAGNAKQNAYSTVIVDHLLARLAAAFSTTTTRGGTLGCFEQLCLDAICLDLRPRLHTCTAAYTARLRTLDSGPPSPRYSALDNGGGGIAHSATRGHTAAGCGRRTTGVDRLRNDRPHHGGSTARSGVHHHRWRPYPRSTKVCVRQHGESGLTAECQSDSAHPHASVRAALLAYSELSRASRARAWFVLSVSFFRLEMADARIALLDLRAQLRHQRRQPLHLACRATAIRTPAAAAAGPESCLTAPKLLVSTGAAAGAAAGADLTGEAARTGVDLTGEAARAGVDTGAAAALGAGAEATGVGAAAAVAAGTVAPLLTPLPVSRLMRREDVRLERLGLARHAERHRLDRCARDLVRLGDLVFVRVEEAARHKGQPALWLARLGLGEVVQLVVFELIVADVAVALAGEEDNVVVAPEGHDDAAARVERHLLERASGEVGRVPQEHLAVGHLGEAGGDGTLLVAAPHHARALDPAVRVGNLHRVLALSRVERADLAVARGGDERGAGVVPVERLDRVAEAAQADAGRRRGGGGVRHVKQLHHMVARRCRQHVGGGGVPDHLAHLAAAGRDAREGLKVLDAAVALALLVGPVELLERGVVHLPEPDGAVVGGGGDKVVLERTEGRVEHRGGVAAAERVDVRQLARAAHGDHGEGTTARRIPVDREVLAVGGDEVGVPRIVGDLDVFVARLLLAHVWIDVAVLGRSDEATHVARVKSRSEERGARSEERGARGVGWMGWKGKKVGVMLTSADAVRHFEPHAALSVSLPVSLSLCLSLSLSSPNVGHCSCAVRSSPSMHCAASALRPARLPTPEHSQFSTAQRDWTGPGRRRRASKGCAGRSIGCHFGLSCRVEAQQPEEAKLH